MPADHTDRSPAPSRRKFIWLLFVCAVSALGGFLFGLDAIVISGAIGSIKPQFGLSGAEEGLFVSASLIGCALGAAGASTSADRLGRKPNLILAGLITLGGVIACTFASSTMMLVLSRFAGGIGVGMASMTCPLYIAETAPAHLRGRLVSLYQFAITVGIMIALAWNAFVSRSTETFSLISHVGHALVTKEPWRLMFAVQIPAAGAFVLLAMLIPESGRWLLARSDHGRARKILQTFLAPEDVEIIIRNFDAEGKGGTKARLRDLLLRQNRMATAITVILAMLSELSGITVIFYYGPYLIQSAGANTAGALSGFAILGIVNMAATVIALALLDRVGRRMLLLVGTSGCAACMFGLACALHLHTHTAAFSIMAICVFVTLYSFSIGPIKFVVASEIFAQPLRSLGTAVGTAMVWMTGAAINQAFPMVRDQWGAAAVFYFCAATLVAQFLFVHRFLPETSRKSLEEIDMLWRSSDEKALKT